MKIKPIVSDYTLVGFIGTPPLPDGNCFSLSLGNKRYHVSNMCYENFQHALGVFKLEDIEVFINNGSIIIEDKRIPSIYYRETPCRICQPSPKKDEDIENILKCLKK